MKNMNTLGGGNNIDNLPAGDDEKNKIKKVWNFLRKILEMAKRDRQLSVF